MLPQPGQVDWKAGISARHRGQLMPSRLDKSLRNDFEKYRQSPVTVICTPHFAQAESVNPTPRQSCRWQTNFILDQ